MSTLKGEFDIAFKLPQGKLFCCVNQRRGSLASAFFVFISLLFYSAMNIYNFFVISLSQLSVQLHWAIFRLIPTQAGGRGGRIVFYMGGVTLDFVTGLGGVPGKASFCFCLKSLVTFSGSIPQGLKESELVELHQPPATIYWETVWKDVIGSVAHGQMAASWHFFILLCVTTPRSKHENHGSHEC